MRQLFVLVVVASAAGGVAVLGGEVARPGVWTCHRAKDGSRQALLGVASAENNGMLLVRCSFGRPTVSLKWANYVGSSPTSVATRLNGGEPVVSRWLPSSDSKELEYSGDHRVYLRELQGQRTLAVRLIPYPVALPVVMSSLGVSGGRSASGRPIPLAADPPLDMTFSLAGLGAAIVEAQGSCRP